MSAAPNAATPAPDNNNNNNNNSNNNNNNMGVVTMPVAPDEREAGAPNDTAANGDGYPPLSTPHAATYNNNDNDDNNNNAEAWCKWCASMGIKLHECVEVKLRPGGGPGAGGGMRARANIKANECFAVVPRDACLSSTTSIAAKGIIDAWVTLSQNNLLQKHNLLHLSLTLMVERLEGRKSRWGPYLATLPRCEATLSVMWREEERGELANSSLEDMVENEMVALEMAFNAAVKPALLNRGIAEDAATLQAFKDAATVVWSRAMCTWSNSNVKEEGGGGQLMAEHVAVLVPIMDLCMHRDAASSNARIDHLNDNHRGAGSENGGGGGGVLRLCSTRAIAAGEEITLPLHNPDAPYLLLRNNNNNVSTTGVRKRRKDDADADAEADANANATVPEHLRCAICLDAPAGNAQQCKNGHIFCGEDGGAVHITLNILR
jgi:hypothetical protein